MNLICSERWQGSGVLREVGGNETVVLRRAHKRYKTMHVWTMSPQKAYMCNVLELIWNVNIKKRLARLRFGATLKLYPPPLPRLSLRQDQKTRSPLTFLRYSELISSSSSSSVFVWGKRCYTKRYSCAEEASFSEASIQRGYSANSYIVSLRLT